ncbi:MAG: FtsX-like permease family protein [Coriobacteriales bacterium]|nr:FtsX-like permease family protein [Coriobacteriales bacterium]
MSVMTSFTKKSLLANRARTVVSAIGIALATALLTAVFTTVSSLDAALLQRIVVTEGSWQVHAEVAASDTQEVVEKLRADSHTATVTVADDQGITAYVDTRLQDAGIELVIVRSLPYDAVSTGEHDSLMCMPTVTEGRLPSAPGEIALPKAMKNASLGKLSDLNDSRFAMVSLLASDVLMNAQQSLEIGSEITIPLYGGFDVSNLSVSLSNAQDMYSGGTLPQVIGKESFTVVGFYSEQMYYVNDLTGSMRAARFALTAPNPEAVRNEQAVGASVWVTTDSRFASQTDINTWAQSIFGDTSYELHYTLLSYQGFGEGSPIWKSLGLVVNVLAFVIAIAAFALISNAFSISVAQRTRQFGLLQSLGATRRQIIGSVLTEAVLLGCISIPLGIVLGVGGVALVLANAGSFLADLIGISGSGMNHGIAVAVSPQIILGAAGFSAVVLVLSALVPAMRASRVSPMEAVRQTQDVRLTKRALRKQKRIAASGGAKASHRGLLERIFGYPGLLAQRNLSRASARGRSVVASLAVSVVLLATAGSFSMYLEPLSKGTYELYGITDDADVTVTYYDHNEDAASGTFAQRTQELAQAFDEKNALELLGYSFGTDVMVYLEPGILDAREVESLKEAGLVTTYSGLTFGENASFLDYAQLVFVEDSLWTELCAAAGVDSSIKDSTEIQALGINEYKSYRNNENRLYKLFSQPGKATLYFKVSQPDDAWISFELGDDGSPQVVYNHYADSEDSSSSQVDYSYDDTSEHAVYVDTGTVSQEYLPADASPDVTSQDVYIIGYVDEMPAVLSQTTYSTSFPALVMPSSYLMQSDNAFASYTHPRANIRLKIAQDADAYEADEQVSAVIKQFSTSDSGIYANNMSLALASMRSLLGFIELLAILFSGITVLVAIANVFNTLTNSIILRTREFAVLASTGLDAKGLARMLIAECLNYALRGLLWGIIGAAITSYLLWYAWGESLGGASFIMPWTSVVLAALGIVVVLAASVLYAIHRSRVLNIAEALRSDVA